MPPQETEAAPVLSGPEVTLPVVVVHQEALTFRRADVDRYCPASRGVRVTLKSGRTFVSAVGFAAFHSWAIEADPTEGKPRRDPAETEEVDRGAVLRTRRK